MIYVGSLIIYCKLFCEVNLSIFAPSKLVFSLMYQLHDFALKSPIQRLKMDCKQLAYLNLILGFL